MTVRLSTIVFYLRERRKQFNIFLHDVFPVSNFVVVEIMEYWFRQLFRRVKIQGITFYV